MVSYVYLASAGVMFALAVIVFVATARGRSWEHYTPELSGPQPGGVSKLVRSVNAWVVGFILLVLLTAGAVLAAVQGGSVTMLLGVFGVLVLGFATTGVYALGRSRGHPHAFAIGEAVITLGLVVLLAVGGQLLTAFGA